MRERRNKRTRTIAITTGIALALLIPTAVYVGAEGLPHWSGPDVRADPVEGQEGCWKVRSITPRQFFRDAQHRVLLKTVPTYWTQILIVDEPERSVIDHDRTDELTLGDVVCSVPGSQTWYYIPTDGIVRRVCDKSEWDCPEITKMPGPPRS